MRLKVLPYSLTVAKYDHVPVGLTGFHSLTVTEHEISLVCESDRLPPCPVAREDGWRALVVEGPLDFSLVGILSSLSGVLAAAKVSIFALSTYDTDYLLVKARDLARALSALRGAAYVVEER
ncbi:MAG: ACT domain-containing protein [Clostridia bacterium]|nr:ACT domain-containing protein [Clostridia bacterium]